MDVNFGAAVGVVIFCFDRPTHLKNLLASVKICELEHLILIQDGLSSSVNCQKWSEVRSICLEYSSLTGCEFVCRESNLGLQQNILTGVSEAFSRFEAVIVLEDDLILAPNFFAEINFALTKLESDIYHIGGYNEVRYEACKNGWFIGRLMYCWGWATTKRCWRQFQNSEFFNCGKISNIGLLRKLDLDGRSDYSNQYYLNLKGIKRTWAVYWSLFIHSRNGRTLLPNITLTENAGLDGSGQNCRDVVFTEGVVSVMLSDDEKNIALENYATKHCGLFRKLKKFVIRFLPGAFLRLIYK